MLLGAIADDFTGASDLGNILAKGGMRTVQYVGAPSEPAGAEVEAGVVALKTRTVPAAEAVAASLAALDWLRAQGCRQFLFKYCSTFDSTPEGNIGPVAEALGAALGADRIVFCPVLPSLGRALYQGHLFVQGRLISETGMARHPLTPMTDPDLRRWLGRQSRSAVGLVGAETVLQGAGAIRAALDAEAAAGRPLILIDAIRDRDLIEIGRAAADLPLLTGGSGVALGLPELFRDRGLIGESAIAWRGAAGPAAILSGSCSEATRGQVARHIADGRPTLALDVDAVVEGRTTAETTANTLLAMIAARPDAAPLAYSSAEPEAVAAAQARHGRERAAAAIEKLFAKTARRLVAGGVTRLVTAGGETSGAVVEGLALGALEIGPEIDPGVPAMAARGRGLALALKSGNFGAPDFFERAVARLGEA